MNAFEFVYQGGYEACQSPRKTNAILQFFNRNSVGGKTTGPSQLVDDLCLATNKVHHLVNVIDKRTLLDILLESYFAMDLSVGGLDKYQLVFLLVQNPPDRKLLVRDLDVFLVNDIYYARDKLQAVTYYVTRYLDQHEFGEEKLIGLLHDLHDMGEYKQEDESKVPDAVSFTVKPVHYGRR